GEDVGIFTGGTSYQEAGGSAPNLIPYNAAANTPGALGAGPDGQGDPIGSAEIFPLIQGPKGLQAVQSWSYNFVGGAKAGSANPLQVQAGAAGGGAREGKRRHSNGGRGGA